MYKMNLVFQFKDRSYLSIDECYEDYLIEDQELLEIVKDYIFQEGINWSDLNLRDKINVYESALLALAKEQVIIPVHNELEEEKYLYQDTYSEIHRLGFWTEPTLYNEDQDHD